jgi:DNA-binding response OmpR family regulator
LLVEDNEKLNEINRRALERKGYVVLTASTLVQARHHVTETIGDIDVILLDITLPDGNGMDFCREIRALTSAHILFLTAVQEHETVIESLERGGDDYIKKPYRLEELLARVTSAMRRRDMAVETTPQTLVRGALTLSPVGAQALLGGRDMNLTVKEFFVLYTLVQNEGKTVPAQTLYEIVWKQPMSGDDHALKNIIYRLRKKLEAGKSTLRIVSSRGEGYSFEG